MKSNFLKVFFLLLICNVKQNNYAQVLDWRQMNGAFTVIKPLPQNPNVLFAGDKAGLLKMSENKGATWKLSSNISEVEFTDIEFLNSQIGFAAVAKQGFVLKTEDGGKTWKQIQLMDTVNANSPYKLIVKRIVAIDSLTLFFDVFNHPISAPTAKEGIVSRDGGKTFKLEMVPGNVYKVTGDTLLAFGREVAFFLNRFTTYKSVDKGMNWTIVKTSPTGLTSDFDFEGMNLACVLNSKVFFITANKSDKNIYKTTDGGLTFSSVSNSVNAKFDYVHFKNMMTGYGITRASSSEKDYYTEDGGTTWIPISQKVQAPCVYLGSDTFISQINGVSAISNDYGKTWSKQSDGLYTPRLTNGAYYNLLYTLNKDVVYASVGRSNGSSNHGFNLSKSLNQGITWNNVKDASGNLFTQNQAPYYFVSADTFFYKGSGYKLGSTTEGGYLKIKYTTDGGKTHVDSFTGNYNENPLEIIFIDKKNGLTYSEFRRINVTSDSGKTWTNRSMEVFGGSIKNLEAPTLNSWYLLTSLGKILKSKDQGITWVDATNGLPTMLQIYFLNDDLGYAFNSTSRKYYKTSDGSQSWVEIPETAFLNNYFNTNSSIVFQNTKTGYLLAPLANGGRAITRTTDGGVTWNMYMGVQSQIGSTLMDFKDGGNTGSILTNDGNFISYTGLSENKIDTLRFQKNHINGVVEADIDLRFKLYPNPAKGIINVEILSEEGLVSEYSIFDISGKLVFTEINESNKNVKIDASTFGKGIYFIKIKTSKGAIYSKFIKE